MENKLNCNRILYLDFVRGLAVIFMIMQHAMILHEKTSGEGNTILGNIIILLGTAPAAPVFIFIMGIFFVKSNKTLRENFIRGLKLFVFGYVLNFIRFTIPVLLAGTPYVPNQDPLSLLLVVDIFQLTGLSLMFFSFLKKYSKNTYLIPILTIIILVISPYLWGMKNDMLVFEPLWGTNENTNFPLFPWSIYFLLGMYFSSYFDKAALSKISKQNLAFISMTLASIGLLTLSIFPIGDYYRSGLSIHFLTISFILLWIVFSNFLINKLKENKYCKILNIIYYCSNKVTAIYIIQWFLFGWSILILGVHEFNVYTAMLIGILNLFLSLSIVKYTKIQRFLPKL